MKIIKKKKELVQKKIGDLFKLNHGSCTKYKKDDSNKYKVYGSGGLIGSTDKFSNPGNSFTIGRKGTLDRPLFIKEPYSTIDTAFSTSMFNGNVEYIYRIVKNIDLIKYSQSSNRPSLTKSVIENIIVFIDEDIEQQQKIANIFSLQEEQIENIKLLIKKIETRNQYYAEKILSGELRVRKNENGDIEFYNNTEWQEDSLKSLFFSKEYSVPKGWKIKPILDNIRLIKGTSINSSEFNYQGMGRQFLRTGDVWEDSSSKKEPAFFDGVVDDKFIKTENDYISCFEGFNKEIGNGTIGLVTNLGEGIISSHLYKTENKNIDGKYYSVALLKTDYIQNILIRNAVGSTVLSSTKCLKDILFIFPDNDEMMLIEDILSSLYSESNNLRKILEKEQLRFQWLLDNLLSGEYQVVDE